MVLYQHEEKEKMRKSAVILIVALAVAITMAVSIFFQQQRVRIITYPMDVSVVGEQNIGFNMDTDGLHFGTMMPGFTGARNIEIKDVGRDILVEILTAGEMKAWVVHDNRFMMKKGEQRNVTFSLAVPENASLRNHTGTVTFILKKA